MHQLQHRKTNGLAPLDLEETTLRLVDYCRANDWAGHDPYDALNSKVFRTLPFLQTRVPRIALTQIIKRSPINLRGLLVIAKTQNPKALALFLTALLKLDKLGLLSDTDIIDGLVSRLVELRSPNTDYFCWGYSFPWQTRTLLVPRGAPNLVCTVFVANALIDAFEATGEPSAVEMAIGAADYLLSDLYYVEEDEIASFSYPSPASKSKVHNANFLAAALLCRLYYLTEDKRFITPALQVARYSAGKQMEDGSWNYGELPNQRWIDNFHTGYNLTALRDIGRYSGTAEFESHIKRGFAFYREHFFHDDGVVRYFHNRTYPIDIHCIAQSFLTLLEFRDLDPANINLLRSVYKWTMAHMWDATGFFYYRVLRNMTIRTSYMRWSQAWMLLALTTFLEVVEDLADSVRTIENSHRSTDLY